MIRLIQFTAVLVLTSLLVSTTRAGMEIPIWAVARDYFDHPWVLPTLIDAYGGFLIFYLWIFYKEPRATGRIVWFVLMMALGNMGAAIYLLIESFKLKPGAPLENFLLRRKT
ncbi:DUF1475 domain-containing protein [candidate division BRC1 bacterium HGW-BRC1-1]|jgi:hypothetical protein|nr:MAG: DUF1475 domain-containing protein [candidate division BRC1 bacterium HGW-BRC1-1]